MLLNLSNSFVICFVFDILHLLYYWFHKFLCFYEVENILKLQYLFLLVSERNRFLVPHSAGILYFHFLCLHYFILNPKFVNLILLSMIRCQFIDKKSSCLLFSWCYISFIQGFCYYKYFLL